jgi:hypothetical protein
MSTTKLDNKTIIEKLFGSTESLLAEIDKEGDRYLEWEGFTVYSQVKNLVEVFNKEKAEFLSLEKSLGDLPVSILAFKNTEAKLLSWQSVTSSKKGFFATRWWGSSVSDRAKGVLDTIRSDKKGLLDLWESSEE